MYDKVPVGVAALVLSAAPAIPGPTQGEWTSIIFGVVALAIREFVYWLRNRG